MPAHQLGGKNECATAAEWAARVALASGVFREGLTGNSHTLALGGVLALWGARKREDRAPYL